MDSLLVFKTIQAPSYPFVRIRHPKYISHLNFPSPSDNSKQMRNPTLRKLMRLKKLTHLSFQRSSSDPITLKKPCRQLITNNCRTIKAIIGTRITIDRSFQHLKDIKVIKEVCFSSKKLPFSLFLLKKVQELSLVDKKNPNILYSIRKSRKLKSFFKRMMSTLTNLRKILFEGNYENLEALKEALTLSKTSVKQVLLSLPGSTSPVQFSVTQIEELITMLSVNIITSKIFSSYLTMIPTFKYLQSLSLTIVNDSLEKYDVGLLSAISELSYLQIFHLLTFAPLEEFITFLKFPSQLTTLMLRITQNSVFHENQDPNLSKDNSYKVLVNEIIKLQDLKSIRLETNSINSEAQREFQEALIEFIENVPPKIEKIAIIDWYDAPGENMEEEDKINLSYSLLLKNLSKTQLLEQLCFYLDVDVSTLYEENNWCLKNLKSLILRINSEEYAINEILFTLNPILLEQLNISKRHLDSSLIHEEEFGGFLEQIKEFKVLKSLKLTGFQFEKFNDYIVGEMTKSFAVLDDLEEIIMTFKVHSKIESRQSFERLIKVFLAKKKLFYCVFSVEFIGEEGEEEEKIYFKFEGGDYSYILLDT